MNLRNLVARFIVLTFLCLGSAVPTTAEVIPGIRAELFKAKRVSNDPPQRWSGTFSWVDQFGGTPRSVDINCPASQNKCRLTGLGSNGVMFFDRGVDLSAVTKGWTNPSQAYAISSPILASGHYFSASPGWKTECTPWPECSREVDRLWMLTGLGGVPVEPWRGPAASGWNLGGRLDANAPSNTRVRLVLIYRPTSPVSIGLYAVWNLESKERDCLADMRRCASIGIGDGVARTPKKQGPSKSTSTTEVKREAQPKISGFRVVIKPVFGEVPVANEYFEIEFVFSCSRSQKPLDRDPLVQITRSSGSIRVQENVGLVRTSLNFRGTYGFFGGLPGGIWKFELTIVDSSAGSCTGSSNPVLLWNGALSIEETPYNPRFSQNPYLPNSLKSGSRPAQCPKLLVLGFRGSGERPAEFLTDEPEELLASGQSYGKHWSSRAGFSNKVKYVSSYYRGDKQRLGFFKEVFGPTVGQHVETLRLSLASSRGIPVSEVGIWSVGVDDIHLTDIWKGDVPQPIYQAAGVRMSVLRWNQGLRYYLESIVTASYILDSKNLFQRYVSDICPEVEGVYAVGYSQGAIFARQAIAELAELNPSKARGLLLIADPLFRYRTEKCCFDYRNAINHVWNDDDADAVGHIQDSIIVGQSLASVLGLPPLETLSKSMRVVSVCVNDDMVCDFQGFKMALKRNRQKSAAIHTDSYKLPNSSSETIKFRVSKLIN